MLLSEIDRAVESQDAQQRSCVIGRRRTRLLFGAPLYALDVLAISGKPRTSTMVYQ